MHSVTPGLRRLAASVLVVAAFIAAFEIGSYRELDTHLPSGVQVVRKFGVEVTPGWAIPVAVAVGVLGLALAVLIYRGRSE